MSASKSSKKKQQKTKARLPRGFVDRSANDIHATNAMIAKIREVYERYGFDPVETPFFEYTDCLGKFLPDTDRPNAGVFSLQDDDDQWMSLRYDLTAPLARHVAENINEIQMPFRSYRAGYVFRNEKPGPGRFRQFMQFDADSIGAPGVQADAEMCMMMADTLEALGIKPGQYVVRVNNRKVLDGVLEAINLGGDEDADRRLSVLRALDKYDKFGSEGVRLLLGKGRKDESGDFTEGANLDERQIEILVEFLEAASLNAAQNKISGVSSVEEQVVNDLYNQFDLPSNAVSLLHKFTEKWGLVSQLLEDGLQLLDEAKLLVSFSGYGDDRILIDPSVVRGLEYYTGMVYEAELLFDVTNEKGEKVQFGSVGGGGRYDGLIKRFTGREVPATGFSIGVSRLMTALKNLGKLEDSSVPAPVLVTVMDGDTKNLGAYQKMVQSLRQARIRAELYQGNWKKFGNQLKYADKRGCPIAIIQGEDERRNSKIQIKDLIEGRRQAEAISSNEEWRESRPGQFEIDEKDLVEEVKKLLETQKVL